MNKKIKLTKEQKTRLKILKERGKWDYVLKYGVVRFGGFMFLFFLVMDFIEKKEYLPIDYIVYPIICIISGLIFGTWTWHKINKKLQKNE